MILARLADHPLAWGWVAILGAAIGSFLNVVIFRVPRGYKLTLPTRSICTACKHGIAWFDNIPLLSYLMRRGRCRHCNSPISARYPLIELLCAALFVAVFRFFGVTILTIYYWWFASALLAITFIDLDYRIIPDVISLPGIAIGLLGGALILELSFFDAATGALFGGGFFWFMGWAYEKVTGREGLGFGDVKLLAMIGAFLGVKGALGTIVISSMLGSVVGILIMFIQKKNLKLAIPYGPFLAIGSLAYLFWGDYLSFRVYP